MIHLVEKAVNAVFLLAALMFRIPVRKNPRDHSVLLCRYDSIGDLVIFGPCLALYRDLYRNSRIVLLVRKEAAPLLAECPWVDELWLLDEKRFRASLYEKWRWLRRLRGEQFDVAINTVYSRSFDQLESLAGWTAAPRRVAHRCLDRPRGRTSPGLIWTELAPTDTEWKEEHQRNKDLLSHLGAAMRDRPDAGAIWLARSDEDWAEAKLRHAGPFALLFPGGGFPEKLWPVASFIETIRRIHPALHATWLLCGTDRESGLCARAEAALTGFTIPCENLCGKTTVGQLAALIGRAVLVLGNDSAPVHIAHHVGTPAAFILGGGHDGRFFSGETTLLKPVMNPLTCYRCYWDCILAEPECVTGISVDKMTEAIGLLPLARQERQ